MIQSYGPFSVGDRVEIVDGGNSGEEFIGRQGVIIPDIDDWENPSFAFVKLDDKIAGQHNWWVPLCDLVLVTTAPTWEV